MKALETFERRRKLTFVGYLIQNLLHHHNLIIFAILQMEKWKLTEVRQTCILPMVKHNNWLLPLELSLYVS